MSSLIKFFIGGSRSGKSSLAEADALRLAGSDARPVYVATCRTDGLDQEMRERIERHQASRSDQWDTVENQFDLGEIAARYPDRIILLDCLTLWLAHWSSIDSDEQAILDRLEGGLSAMREHGVRLVVVSNEIGGGLVPLGKENREYRDLVGSANQLVAAQADEVDWVVAGIPVSIKPK